MVNISSQNNKINVTVSSSGNTANTNVTPDYAQYYSEKSKEWATSNKIVDNIDYSSKYYANESKKQADISTAKATEVVESGNTAVSNIESARNNAITNVNTAGATQVALATEQATIATNKASEVVASGNEALANIDTAKNNAITSITNQETTSKNVLIDEGATQIGLIQNEGATQIANVQSTGFYMRDDKLYYINSQGEEVEFKDASEVEEQLANKQDKLIRYPIEISDKSLMPSWYVVYNDGWCEQGGILGNCSSSNYYSVSLIKVYANTNYEILLSADIKGYQVTTNIANYGNYQITSSTFYIFLGKVEMGQPDTSEHKIYWKTCAFLPQV